MTAFIKNLREKRQEWSGQSKPRTWNTSQSARQYIENLPSFKAVQAEMDAGVQAATERLKEERNEDAKKQRWKTRTSEEKARECIDSLTGKIKMHGEMGLSTASTHEEARAKAVEVAERFDRESKGDS